jgi:hypothetical protein
MKKILLIFLLDLLILFVYQVFFIFYNKIKGDGKLYGFGRNHTGELGFSIDNENYIYTPYLVSDFNQKINKVVCGDSFTLILSGKLFILFIKRFKCLFFWKYFFNIF